MNQHNDELKKEFIYSIVLIEKNKGELSYQVNPELTVGLDPRNEIILVSPLISSKHLVFEEENGELKLTFLGKENTTFLNSNSLFPNQKYFLKPSDQIVIGQFTLKIKKELAYRYQKKNIQNQISFTAEDLKKPTAIAIKTGFNLNPLDEEPDEIVIDKVSTSETRKQFYKDNSKKIKSEYKKSGILIFNKNFLKKLIPGLIFDFFMAYFLLSMMPVFRIHLFNFYMLIEVLCILMMRAPLFSRFLEYKFMKGFGAWILLFFFILAPFSREGFDKFIYKGTVQISKDIDLHGNLTESIAKNELISLSSNLNSDEFFIPHLQNQKLQFHFGNLSKHQKMVIEFDQVISNNQVINYINRTNPFVLPIKKSNSNIDAINFFDQLIEFNHTGLVEAIKHYGPFLSYISDTKYFFLSQLGNKIERIKFSENTPVILVRDERLTKLFIIGKTNMFLFHYLRPKNRDLEEVFIEKILANIQNNLIKKRTSEIGFLEIFDSLPKADIITMETLVSLGQQKILGLPQNTFSKELLDQLQSSLDNIKEASANDESRNTGTIIIKQNIYNILFKKFEESQ